MIIDRTSGKEYPFEGDFIGYDEDSANDVVILKTKCDIQQVSYTDNQGLLKSAYKIFFPFDESVGVNIKRGNTFKGKLYGLEINGTINEPYPTQLGVCEVVLQDMYA